MNTFQEQFQGLDNHLMLGLPLQPPLTNFSRENDISFTSVQNPSKVAQFYIGISRPLSNDSLGVGVFYSPPPFTNMIYLTAIANEQPSQIVTTDWGFKEELFNTSELKLVFKVDLLENFRNLHVLKAQNNPQLEFAKNVAQNLYNFFESFPKQRTQDHNNEEIIMLPGNAFQIWMNKFESKFRIDPYFVYKSKE